MHHLPVISDIRVAQCTIHETAAFLRELRAIAAAHDTHIICFNAEMIAGRAHAASAVARAVRALGEGVAISNNLEMEALLFAAGSRQCNIAASFGIHKGENLVYICCFPARAGVWAALDQMFHFVEAARDTLDSERRTILMETFAISPEELAAAGGDRRIVDLVLERVALLQVNR